VINTKKDGRKVVIFPSPKGIYNINIHITVEYIVGRDLVRRSSWAAQNVIKIVVEKIRDQNYCGEDKHMLRSYGEL
jgi:hypothetical protein